MIGLGHMSPADRLTFRILRLGVLALEHLERYSRPMKRTAETLIVKRASEPASSSSSSSTRKAKASSVLDGATLRPDELARELAPMSTAAGAARFVKAAAVSGFVELRAGDQLVAAAATWVAMLPPNQARALAAEIIAAADALELEFRPKP